LKAYQRSRSCWRDDLTALEVKVRLALRPKAVEGEFEVVQVDLERSLGWRQI
jgi:hypothetical protein